MPFWVEEIQTTRLLMRSRLVHTSLTFATLVVAALVWLVPSVARASATSEASFEASFSASVVLHTPAPDAHTAATARDAGGPATATTKAPLCDPRGAITFASAPQMQDLEVTLDTGLTLDDCFGAAHGTDANQAAGSRRAPLPSDAAVLRAAVVLAAPGRELLPVPGPSTTCSRPGVRSTVDRPPRA